MKPKLTLLLAAATVALAAAAIAVVLVADESDPAAPAAELRGGSSPAAGAGGTAAMPGMSSEEGADGKEMEGAAAPDPSSLPETPILSPTRMGDLVMPPGMVVTGDADEEGMKAMAAVDLAQVAYRAPAGARGDRPLTPKLVNGVKELRLRTSLIEWNILPDVRVAAYAFNRQVPGPRIRLTEGDRVRIVVENGLPEPTSVHWHGLSVPNGMDGAAEVTQKPIPPGGSFTYEFTVDQAGTFFYHSHQQADRQQSLGLYGALIVEPREQAPRSDRDVVVQLQEWTVEEGYTFPSMPQPGFFPNYFTINGKAYPETETIRVKQGERISFRFIGSSTGFTHPMHIHGGSFAVVATDGNAVPPAAQLVKDTISVAPGERWDVVWTAQRKGTWLVHCHVLHHTTNDDVETEGGGGLTMVIEVV